MADHNPYSYEENATETQPVRHGVDVFTLIMGVATLLVSA